MSDTASTTLTDIRDELRGLRAEMREGDAALREEIHGLRDEMRADRERQAQDFRALIARPDGYFQTLITRQDRDFRWLVGLYLAGMGALLAVLAHGFHWV